MPGCFQEWVGERLSDGTRRRYWGNNDDLQLSRIKLRLVLRHSVKHYARLLRRLWVQSLSSLMLLRLQAQVHVMFTCNHERQSVYIKAFAETHSHTFHVDRLLQLHEVTRRWCAGQIWPHFSSDEYDNAVILPVFCLRKHSPDHWIIALLHNQFDCIEPCLLLS